MLKIVVSTQPMLSHAVDCYAYILEKDFSESHLADSVKAIIPDLPLIMKHHEFSAKALESLIIPTVMNGRAVVCAFIGFGDTEERAGSISRVERYRRALGTLIKHIAKHKCVSIALRLPSPEHLQVTPEYLAETAAITLRTADYHFDEYFSEKKEAHEKLESITLLVDENYKDDAQKGVDIGQIIGDAVNQTRHWVDSPPSVLTPQILAQKAQDIAKKHNLSCTVFGEKQINEMGMGGLAAVSRGSEEDCALIILEYKAQQQSAPTLCFVGKGITFDSGGLSIKPASSMETMKEDMSGAAAVISAIGAMAQLKIDVNIIAIAPTSENLPSGRATKPGDIIRFYNGKTAEVKNTDAEGRLILADALSYAVKHYQPDAIVDLATLTGSCAHALGPYFSGLFSQHEDLVNKLQRAAIVSGDLLWRLPMNDDYKKAISSTIADVCNIGSKNIYAGAITAAHFLQHFVGEVPWAHIDIAGTAYDVPNISYYRPGATGAGVRLLVALARNWDK